MRGERDNLGEKKFEELNNVIKKNTLEDWVKEKYIYNAKFKALVETLFRLMVSGDFTPVELKQALDLALNMRKEAGVTKGE